MKRLVSAVATTGLLAASLGVGVLSQPAFAADGGLTVSINSAGTKKVVVTWVDGLALASGPFDAYLVTLDNDANVVPADADRSRFVDDGASPLEARFEDLNSNTSYFAAVYAVDFTDSGYSIVTATGQGAGTPLGVDNGSYSPLTIKSSAATALSGNAVTISGTLEDDANQPLPNKTVNVLYDVYPQFGGAVELQATTDSSGNWNLTSPALTENTWFWAEYRPTGDVGGWTGRVLVEVRKKISASVTPGLTVAAGTSVKFSGNLNSDPSYLDDAAVTACLQRLEAGKWGKLFCRPIDPNGDYTLTFKPGPGADGKYRVFSGMGPAYADSWSKVKKLVVN